VLSGRNPIIVFIFMLSLAISSPAIIAVPEVGDRVPHSIRIVVVLPAPLGPIKPNILPDFTLNVKESTALKDPYVFPIPIAEIPYMTFSWVVIHLHLCLDI
jgi:hypothetical protein